MKFEVRNKAEFEDSISVGGNTEIFIDGKKAKNLKSFKYEVHAGGVGSVTLEFYGSVAIDANVIKVESSSIEASNNVAQVVGNYEQTYITGDKNEF